MFAEELKEGTRQAHLNLEKKLVDQIRKVKSVKDYVQLLELMYGYYQPLQKSIEKNIADDSTRQRTRQSRNIINDIKELDPSHPLEFRLCSDLPPIQSRAASLGALYVTEGSTLGGQIISKMISRQLNIPADKGFTFFNAYGEKTEKMWQEFKSMLNDAEEPLEKEEMMKSARYTFEKFNDWITLYE